MSDRGHGLTAETILASVPVALRKDVSMAALAEVAARALASRPEEIDRIRLYAQIDRLEEPLLSILAHDFKVDWWDPEYTVEQKRRTLKESWLVHMRLGTRYAVTTALGAVFPGASVLEWFQYGGSPYCFRVDIPLPEEGITEGQLYRALDRIWYYKNLRSHLESVNIHGESTGILGIGGFTSASLLIEIWPELVSGVELTGESGTGGLFVVGGSVHVYPELTVQAELTGQDVTGAVTTVEETVGIYPELATQAEVTAQSVTGSAAAARQTVEVYPALAEMAELDAQAGAGGIAINHQMVEIYPE